jgi:hypothetical protein
MLLNVTINDQTYPLEIPEDIVLEGEAFFAKMDSDMDAGWQMSREWVDHPNPRQRCQIAADKLLTALETENQQTALLMAGYIITRMPGVTDVHIDTTGDISATEFTVEATAPAPVVDMQDASPPMQSQMQSQKMSKMEAMAQAGKEVTKVFKIARGYKFSTYDREQGRWVDSPLIKDKPEADRLRMQAFKERFDELMG